MVRRFFLLLIPFALAGCESTINDLGNRMPVLGQRCQQGVCLTSEDAQHSQGYEAYKAHMQQQQPSDTNYYAPANIAPPEDNSK